MTHARAHRRRYLVEGTVQGVGFRPFVHRLAKELGLGGTVINDGGHLIVEAEGTAGALDSFVARLRADAPVAAHVTSVTVATIPTANEAAFGIAPSRHGDVSGSAIPPDLALCAACIAEFGDPRNRRYRHPFITCTDCGPRYTVARGMPFDRERTVMADFEPCDDCAAEYGNPGDRRFHAQTLACHACGPVVSLIFGREHYIGDAAINRARRLLADGAILAVKGVGGYHLACDATTATAVSELRTRKGRPHKPFAVMVRSVDAVNDIACASPEELTVLGGPAAPIVLLHRRTRPAFTLAAEIAPGCEELGVMVPYTPLHRLIMEPGATPAPRALVMTSANLAGGPIVIDDTEARSALAGVTDGWLLHDRRIEVPCDDSVVRVVARAPLVVRRSRGYAPVAVALPFDVRPALAVGGDTTNAVCLAQDRQAWLSAHIGDLDDVATLGALTLATEHLSMLTGVHPEAFIVDRHPGYRSAAWAQEASGDRPVVRVQHHHAHIASVMAENGHDGSRHVLGFVFDGTGFGEDGCVWGGEVLLATYDEYARFGHLRPVTLPGGDAVVKNPYRIALAHLDAAGAEWSKALPCVAACTDHERSVLWRQLRAGVACTATSSMGRLFDAVASIAGLCQRASYEAEAAVRLQAAAQNAPDAVGEPYAFRIQRDAPRLEIDPGPVVNAAALDALAGVDATVIAARFHRAVADMVSAVARVAASLTECRTAALSGGVFANPLLLEWCDAELRALGWNVLRHRFVPPGDGGLALGQIAIAARRH